ncbi:TetR/AcrR family transcriptional regulator [Mycobacterium sp.]|uniref:TetR/AcrR family transcriptional regulator n=1 Tax=Mycobacterium sp. TaxID=1785 RepID=UPI003BAFF18F
MLTPNQLAKRQQLVTAAQTVLRRDGVNGCTSRAIARESGVNNGLVHYYFETVEAIVDAAMWQLVDEIVGRIRMAADRCDDPAERFWSVVEAHLDAFESPDGQTVLWMDYWVDAVRAGRTDIIGHIDDMVIKVLTEALTAANAPEPRTRARAICAYVTGAAIRRRIRRQTQSELRAEILTMSGGVAFTARRPRKRMLSPRAQ